MSNWDENIGVQVDGTDPTQGHVIIPPDEMVMAMEEAVSLRDDDGMQALIEVFRQVLCFVFYDDRCRRRLGWDYAAAAIEVLYKEFVPSLWYGLPVDESARRQGVGLVSGAGGGVHELLRRADAEVLARVLERVAVGLEGRLWLLELTRRWYSLAKLLDEDLLGGVTLAELGEIFGEGNPKAARARWSERNQVVLRILAGGAVMRARYQKSGESCERMRAAQMGNKNRKAEKLKS